MGNRTNEGFPRPPFPRTAPNREEVEREVNRGMAGGEPIDRLLMRVFGVYETYYSLAQRNYEFETRQWGVTDVAENSAEQWNYLRNANFLSLTYKWANNAAMTRSAVLNNLPYGVPRAINIINNVGTKNWIQQSASATGATWYVAAGWINVAAGNGKAGFEVVENSGSTSARTHAAYYPVANGDWRHMDDHRRQNALAFKTYKGTTKLTFRCVLGSSMAASYAEVQLEKGRRPHPWRHHFLDRGNLVTSLKTAGSASWTGNITFSASTGAAVRQKATKTFVYGVKTTTAKPNKVSTSGTAGTSASMARADHVHRGVTSLFKTGGASADGRVGVVGSGGATVQILATNLRVHAASGSTAKPGKVSTSGTAGTAATYSKSDHVHRGVTSIFKLAGASADGRVGVVGSGGATVQILSTNLRVHAASASSTTPNKVSSAGAVGSAATYAKGDHIHRGVTALKYGGTSNDGTIAFSGSGTGGALAWSGTKLKFGWPKPRTTAPNPVSATAATGTTAVWARGDHVHRGVKAIKVKAAGSADGTVTFSASTNAGVRISGSKVIIQNTGGSGSGAAVQTAIPGGRLTLTSGTAVTTADVTAAGTIYYTPYLNDRIALYSGAAWAEHTFTERSLALTVTSGKNYDVFLYNNAGTLTLELSAAWTNDTTRADALTTQDGVYVKSGATTRRYLGTIRASAANQTEDSAAKRFVWNMYNQESRILRYLATDATWTCTSATIRQANASANYAVSCVTGLTQFAHVEANVATITGGSDYEVGIGVDSTTTFHADATVQYASPITAGIGVPLSSLLDHAALGYRSYSWNEHSVSAGVGVTVYGDGGAGRLQSAINGEVLG